LRNDVIAALGHLHDLLALPYMLRFLESKDDETRAALAAALINFQDNKDAINAMRKLKKDHSRRVRYWLK